MLFGKNSRLFSIPIKLKGTSNNSFLSKTKDTGKIQVVFF